MAYPLLPAILGEDWPLSDSFTIEPQSSRTMYPVDLGPPLEAVQFTGMWEKISFTRNYTKQKYAVLKLFYYVTLGQVGYFIRIDPQTGAPGTFRFLSAPVPKNIRGSDFLTVSISLASLPVVPI